MKIGQRVRLLGFSTKYPDKYNPKDCDGKVVSLDGRFDPIIVEWDNGYRNSYTEKDLEKVFSYNKATNA